MPKSTRNSLWLKLKLMPILTPKKIAQMTIQATKKKNEIQMKKTKVD